jgi:hypothetical protein
LPGFQIGKAVAFAIDDLIAFDDEDGGSRMVEWIYIGKDGIDLAIMLAHRSASFRGRIVHRRYGQAQI